MNTEEARRAWRRVLWVGRAEGATLLALVGVAAPLKHLADVPTLSRVLSPLHGVVFVGYLWCVVEVLAAESGEPGPRVIPFWLLVAAALVPFGTWMSGRRIRRALDSSSAFESSGHQVHRRLT
jgi:integral membrane protein